MRIILLLMAAAVVLWIVITIRSARRRNREKAEAPTPRTDPLRDVFTEEHNNPYDAKLGDMIELRRVTYYVRGILDLSEDGWDWRELYLDDGAGNTGWLSMERDPDLELTWWTDHPDHGKTPTKTITINKKVFTREESGTALYHTEGVTGLRRSGTCRYHDYRAKDGALISLESWSDEGDKWELSSGEELDTSEVTIYINRPS